MSLTVTFTLPADVETRLLAQAADINRDVREAYALELFRRGTLSHHELSQTLGLDRFETDALLKRHNVVEGSLTMEDLQEQQETLNRVMGPVRKR